VPGVLLRWVVHRTGRDRRTLLVELFQRWPKPTTRSHADPLSFRERDAVFAPSQKFSSGSRPSNSSGVDLIVAAAERITPRDSSARTLPTSGSGGCEGVETGPVFHNAARPQEPPGIQFGFGALARSRPSPIDVPWFALAGGPHARSSERTLVPLGGSSR
jgi:hypothetical protein